LKKLIYISSRLNHLGHLTLLRALRNELGQDWKVIILKTPQVEIPNQHEIDSYDDFKTMELIHADGMSIGETLLEINPDAVYIQDEFFLNNCMQVLYTKFVTNSKWKVITCLCENILDNYISRDLEHLYKEIDLLLPYAEFSYKNALKLGFPDSVPVVNRVIPHPRVVSFEKRYSTDYISIGFLGRLIEEKGVKTLVDAFKLLDFPAKLFLMGEGELHGYGLPDERITYKGINKSNQEKADFLKSMDVVVCPSISTPTWIEQAILVAQESLCLSTPVIGSNSGGISEMIDPEFVFQEGSVEDLLKKLKLFYNIRLNNDNMRCLREKVRQIYIEERSPDACAKRIAAKITGR
jgi:glycosyltransferase involved in cell wall biosynthesis